MRVLHFYKDDNGMIARHVNMLSQTGHCVTEAEQARTLLGGGKYDILHLHGCWRNSSKNIVKMALRQGCRLVVTPHGELEPWVQEENRWQEKLPKRLLYQRDIIHAAYAVIVQGPMEAECMKCLEWNPRTVVIRNAAITQLTSAQEMVRQTQALYQKVLDSNPLELMGDKLRLTLKAIIATGITNDRRWLESMDDEFSEAVTPPSNDEWRLLLLYAHQEDIVTTLQRGIRILGLDAPELDVENIPCFLPPDYQAAESIGKTIGNEFATENERLLATFKVIRKLTANKQLSIKHLVELDSELRYHGCEEELLADDLKERHMWKLASRVMQLMTYRTGLTEGFMPVPPIDDRTTRSLLRQVDNRLKI